MFPKRYSYLNFSVTVTVTLNEFDLFTFMVIFVTGAVNLNHTVTFPSTSRRGVSILGFQSSAQIGASESQRLARVLVMPKNDKCLAINFDPRHPDVFVGKPLKKKANVDKTLT